MDNPNHNAIRTDGVGEPLRVGVYVCKCGGNISDVIDVDRVAAEAGNLPGVAVARFRVQRRWSRSICRIIAAL